MTSIFSIFKESSESFEGQEKDERVVFLLRKHPFTILLPLNLFLLAGLAPILIFIIFYSSITESLYFLPFIFLSSIFYLGLWLVIFYHLTIYMLNTVIITDKRIIDRDQHGFFNQEISELHLNRVQDVTAYTKGALKTFLHYGDVHVQTASSEKQFIFHDVANPEKLKTDIMKVVAEKHSGVKKIKDVHNLNN
jgi:uncharacterized membrane protein YdbT with pleckstrin-like domain